MNDDAERWKQMTQSLSWRKVAWWPVRDMCRLGIDIVNLLCAIGLPSAEKMDIDYCLRKIGQWAEKVQFYTAQMMHKYDCEPEKYHHSRAYFKALCLITVLQRDCGVRYNPKKRDPDVPFEPADSFLFGIIQGNGGTCASLPVLYCAVAHRLGYPMFLISARGEPWDHLFVRWDDGEIRFNIEASSEGMTTPKDEYFRAGRYQPIVEAEVAGCYMKPKNMPQSFAGFLMERALYWRDLKEYHHAIEAAAWAVALHPENTLHLNTAKAIYQERRRQWEERTPAGFPEIFITEVQRRFPPSVPFKFELDLCGLEAKECLLKDKRHDLNLWEPMRRGKMPLARPPIQVECKVDRDGGKDIRFLFERKHSQKNGGDFANV